MITIEALKATIAFDAYYTKALAAGDVATITTALGKTTMADIVNGLPTIDENPILGITGVITLADGSVIGNMSVTPTMLTGNVSGWSVSVTGLQGSGGRSFAGQATDLDAQLAFLITGVNETSVVRPNGLVRFASKPPRVSSF